MVTIGAITHQYHEVRYPEPEPEEKRCPICDGLIAYNPIRAEGSVLSMWKCTGCEVMATEEAWEAILDRDS